MQEMEVRLSDYEDTAQQVQPSQLPQAQAKPKDLWTRFRRAIPSFVDVVLDTTAAIHDNSYLVMSDDVHRKVIKDLNTEIEVSRRYKNRYEKIVDTLSQASEQK